MASWILTAGIAVVGWLVADPGTLAQSLDVGTRLWLLGNGVSASLAGTAVTVVPWGATALIAFMLSRFAAVAARQVRADQTAGPAAITVVLVATYLVPVVAVAVWRGDPGTPRSTGRRSSPCSPAQRRWAAAVRARAAR